MLQKMLKAGKVFTSFQDLCQHVPWIDLPSQQDRDVLKNELEALIIATEAKAKADVEQGRGLDFHPDDLRKKHLSPAEREKLKQAGEMSESEEDSDDEGDEDDDDDRKLNLSPQLLNEMLVAADTLEHAIKLAKKSCAFARHHSHAKAGKPLVVGNTMLLHCFHA